MQVARKWSRFWDNDMHENKDTTDDELAQVTYDVACAKRLLGNLF